MIKAIVFDFSRVLINLVDESTDIPSLNQKHNSLKQNVNYNLFDHFILNNELLNYLDNLKRKIPLYIYTNGILHLEQEIAQKITPVFKEIFTDKECGKKNNPQSFIKLAELINKNPSEILFIDDTEDNILAAKKAAFNAIHYKNNYLLFQELNKFL